ncbi:hypothetical protein BU16DRAFT_565209 [Lophium mytilinum]|uniref:BTB domain-containing protein n=1 Tax=Lophium mytilinum TaxID=390894 RepID=A0A6A6QGG5_9PEZI|nr:hypothetical protein BU16DRAFT_565209 [Lophium mytilinum]
MGSTDPEAPGLVILESYGDVILNFADGRSSRLLVSSNMLSRASPVFRAMFTGGFAESQGLSSSSPREVSLPEDDPYATVLLCRIVHLKHNEVPKTIDIELLIQLTWLCDKYQCALAVQPWAMYWVTELLSHAAERTLQVEKLLLIAYELDLAEPFYKVAEALVREPSPDANVLHLLNIFQRDHSKLLETIKEQRLSLNRNLMGAFEHIMHPYLYYGFGDRSCQQEAVGQYFVALAGAGLYPPSEKLSQFTIPQIMHKLGSFKMQRSAECRCKNGVGCKGSTSDPTDIQSQLEKQLKIIDKNTKGLCLDCWNAERDTYDSESCRVRH